MTNEKLPDDRDALPAHSLSKRVTALIELGVGAAGLAVYLTVLGGLQLWVKLEAAGLPGDAAISGYDTRALAVSGTRALAVLPLAFGVLMVLVRVLEEDRPRDKRNVIARALDRLDAVLIPIMFALVGAVVGVSFTVAIAEALLSREDASFLHRILTTVGLSALLLVFCLVVPALFMAARRLRRGWRRRRAQSSRPSSGGSFPGPVDRLAAGQDLEPSVFVWVRGLTSAFRGHGIVRWALAAVGLLTYLLVSACVLVLALDHGGERGGVLLIYASLALGFLPYVFLALRVAAPLWRTVTTAELSGTFDETTAVVGVVVLASFVLPLWAGAYVVSMMLLVFLAGQGPLAPTLREGAAGWLPSSLPGRVFIVAIVLAAAAVVFQTRQPQRFPLAIIPVDDRALTAEAAVLGRADGQLMLGVCRRQRNGTSSGVELIRIPASHVPSYRVVDDGYVFYRDHEPTLLSGILTWLELPVYRPSSFNVFLGNPTHNVCGPAPQTPAWVFDHLRRYKAP